MAILHFFDVEGYEWESADCYVPTRRCASESETIAETTHFHLFKEKIRMPQTAETIHRPRLIAVLDRTLATFPATAIIGRAGTGKTTLAAEYIARSGKQSHSAWMEVGPTEFNWQSFALHLAASVAATNRADCLLPAAFNLSPEPLPDEIETFLSSILHNDQCLTRLLIIDNLHYILMRPGFADFCRF